MCLAALPSGHAGIVGLVRLRETWHDTSGIWGALGHECLLLACFLSCSSEIRTVVAVVVLPRLPPLFTVALALLEPFESGAHLGSAELALAHAKSSGSSVRVASRARAACSRRPLKKVAAGMPICSARMRFRSQHQSR